MGLETKRLIDGMFGNQNKKRKIKRLQREKQRAKIKKAKAAAAAKKRLRKLAESRPDGEEHVATENIAIDGADDVKTTQVDATGGSTEAIDSLPSEKEVAKAKAQTSMSRRKRKFLEKIMEKKEKKAKRQALFDSLSASKLSPTHSKLLVRSATSITRR